MGVKGLKVLSFPFLSLWGGGSYFQTVDCYISVEPRPQYQHKFYHGEVGAPFSKLYTATFLSNQTQNTDINFPRGRKGLFFFKLYTAAFLFTQAQNTSINFTCGSGYNKVKLEKVLQKQNQDNHNKGKG